MITKIFLLVKDGDEVMMADLVRQLEKAHDTTIPHHLRYWKATIAAYEFDPQSKVARLVATDDQPEGRTTRDFMEHLALSVPEIQVKYRGAMYIRSLLPAGVVFAKELTIHLVERSANLSTI